MNENVTLDHVKITKQKKLPVWIIALVVILVAGLMGVIGQGLRLSGFGPLEVGKPVPSFSLTTFDGKTISSEELRGKIVLLNFWASWCQPCEQEADYLEQAWLNYAGSGKVVFLGVDYMDTEPAALEFIGRYNVTYPNGPDLKSSISNSFRVTGVPETFIFDRDGNMAVYKYGPFMSEAEITQTIDSLMN